MAKNMESLFEEQNNLSLFTSECSSAQGKFLPFVLPDESDQIHHICNSVSENIVSCKDSHLQHHLNEIDGLDLETVTGNPISSSFPIFIPIVTKNVFPFSSQVIPEKIIGVRLKDIIYTPPRKIANRIHLPRKLRIREDILQYPIFKNKKTILFTSGQDALIEKLWRDKSELNFAKTIQSMGISMVTGINFSLFWGECPVGHAINLKRSLKSVEYFQDAGLQAIPHVYFLNINHINRWTSWLENNISVKLVTINCQFSRDSKVATSDAEGIKMLINRLENKKIDFLLECPSGILLQKLHQLGCSKYIRVAAQQPSMAILFGKKYFLNSAKLKMVRTKGLSKELLFQNNVLIYENYIKHFSSIGRSEKPLISNQVEMQFGNIQRTTTKSRHLKSRFPIHSVSPTLGGLLS